jgi:hypothetical protein
VHALFDSVDTQQSTDELALELVAMGLCGRDLQNALEHNVRLSQPALDAIRVRIGDVNVQ